MTESTRKALRPLARGTLAALGAAALAVGVLAAPAAAQNGVRASGVDTSNFDRAVRPQDDFFRYVNGRWYDRTEIPGDASAWGAVNEPREGSRNALKGDPHSPGMARAFVPLVNNDAFLRAFDVKPGDRMYPAPEERVRVW